MKTILEKLLVMTIVLLPISVAADNFIGYVVDEDGDPIPFASVYVKNNPYLGTMTNEEGRYELDVDMNENRDESMVFSFIGYKTEESELRSMQLDSLWYVTLEEQPIMLDGPVVMEKISRRESKKIKKHTLERFIEQLAKDFPDREVEYQVFSMYNGSQSDRDLIRHEIIGTITEYPIENRKGNDSVSLVVKNVKEYTADALEEGYVKFNEMANERINHNGTQKKKSKKNKNNQVAKLTYTARSLDDQALRVHKYLWGGPTGSIIGMIDTRRAKKWDYTMVGNDNVLTYTEKRNFMGIVIAELQIHFYIDPADYSVQKIAQSLEGELHIPFGYKLKKDELDFINTLQMGYDSLERYKARHMYVDVKRNVFIQKRDGKKVVREKNLAVDVDVIGSKKKTLNYNAEAKAIVSGNPKVKE